MTDQILSAVRDFQGALAGKNRIAVNETAKRLIDLRAPLGRQWPSVAAALKWNGEISLALAALDEMMRASPEAAASARYTRANVLYASSRVEDALAELDSLIADGMGPSGLEQELSHLNFRASILLLMGRGEEAKQHLYEALELDGRSGQAWLTFTEVSRFTGKDADYAPKLEEAYRLGARLPGERAKLAHAAGRMRHLLRDYPAAFEAFADAARLFEPHPGDKSGELQEGLISRVTSWSREMIDAVAARITVPHDRVLFVTGLPRSGTTLVEQILASHPDVDMGEEYGFFRIVAQDIGGVDAASFQSWLDRGGDPNSLVELYMRLATERVGADTRFIDKTVEAGKYMGLLLALFPKSPVFWLRRDPIDNGWSAFRTYFARGAGWSWDLRKTGERLAQEDEMIEHWAREAPDRVAFVDYAALVKDPEPHIRKIAQAAGLEPTEQMFRPHETQRVVATASASQVRQPINLKGIGVADPYRAWLGPMIETYEAMTVRGR